MKRPKLFYGWVIAAASAVTMTVGAAIRLSFSLFFVAAITEFGWPRGTTAGAVTVTLLLYGLSAPFVGSLLSWLGIRRVLAGGAFLLGLGLMAGSQITNLPQLYLLYTFLAVGVGVLGFVPHAWLLSNWFVRKRATALGLVFAGWGIGPLLILPATQYMISHFGWRISYVAIGGLALITIPLITRVLRSRPEEMGLLPDGAETLELEEPTRTDQTSVQNGWTSRVWTPRAAVSTRQFWILFVVHFCIGAYFNTIGFHQVAHLVDVGFEPLLAAFVVAVLGLLYAFASIGAGFICDWLGRELTFSLAASLIIPGVFVLMSLPDRSAVTLLWFSTLLLGLGFGLSVPSQAATQADFFQGPHLSTIMGYLELPIGLGAGLGVWLGGYLFDVTGSYQLVFSLAMLGSTVAAIGYWLAAPRKLLRVGYSGRGPSLHSPPWRSPTLRSRLRGLRGR
jgi:MFS family permease